MKIDRIEIDDMFVADGRRPLDRTKVAMLAESIKRLGLLQPITVHAEGGRVRLVAGRHRLAAAVSLGWSQIDAVFLDGDDAQLRLAEIAENLHRSELTAIERDELTAEWIRLTEGQPAQVEPAVLSDGRKKGPQHAPSGVSAAARELGISKADAQRAVKVASLSPEAKQVAREVGLDDNRSALLAAADEKEPEKQVHALRERAYRNQKQKKKRRPRGSANPPMAEQEPRHELDLRRLQVAWEVACKSARKEFMGALGLAKFYTETFEETSP